MTKKKSRFTLGGRLSWSLMTFLIVPPKMKFFHIEKRYKSFSKYTSYIDYKGEIFLSSLV